VFLRLLDVHRVRYCTLNWIHWIYFFPFSLCHNHKRFDCHRFDVSKYGLCINVLNCPYVFPMWCMYIQVVAKNIGTLALFSNNSQFSRKICWHWQKYLVSTILYFTVNITEPLFLVQNWIYPFKSENIKRNGIDKIIDTRDLIFGSTAFGQNNYSQALPIAMNELPPPLYWQFVPLFLCKLLQFSQIWRVPSPNCCFQISPQVFNGI